jgi:hypothetical protein
MARWLIALSIVVHAMAAHAAEEPVSARKTMLTLAGHLRAGEVEVAREMALTAAEFAQISRRPVDSKEYQKRLAGFLSAVSRELKAGVELDEVVCADALILPAGVKIKREVVMAVVHVTFRLPGKPAGSSPMAFLFIRHGGQWKLFLRK